MNYPFKTNIADKNTLKINSHTLHENSIINIAGKNNTVTIGDKLKGRLVINITGDNSTVVIGNNVTIMGILDIFVRRGNTELKIGMESSFQGHVRLFNHESSSIIIGDDCMFSGDIMVTTSDMHAIYDANKKRINPAAPIIFGKHVWVGTGVKILKGVTIGDGSIVGMSSLVTRGEYPKNCIIAGNPGKIVKENIHWTRELP